MLRHALRSDQGRDAAQSGAGAALRGIWLTLLHGGPRLSKDQSARVLIAAVRGFFAAAPRRAAAHKRSPPRNVVGPDRQRRKIESPRISRRADPAGNVSGSATASPALPIMLQPEGQPSSTQPIVRALSVGAWATLTHSRG